MATQDRGTTQQKGGKGPGNIGGNGSATSTQQVDAMLRQNYSFFNARQFDRMVALCTDDVRWVNVATGETYNGKDGVRRWLESWSSAFPDAQVEITRIAALGDSAVAEFMGRGRHTGTLRGPNNLSIPPTNKTIDTKFCDVLELRHGLISSGRTYFDMASMLSQLGVNQPR